MLIRARVPFVRENGDLFEITRHGQEALEGNADFIELNGVDRWLGGVHLVEDNVWKRDPYTGQLIRDELTQGFQYDLSKER